MTVRKYSSVSIDTTLTSGGISNSATSMSVVTGTGSTLMGGITLTPGDIFTVAIDPDTTSEEICYITARSGDVFTISRAQAGTTAVVHATGATVRHVLSSADLNYFNQAIQSTTAPGFTPTIDGGTPSAVSTQMQARRASAAVWTSTNPILAAGEAGFETDTTKMKIGNGSSTWTGLPYTGGISSLTAGTGLTGGTITSTGTIGIDSTVVTLTGTQSLSNKTLTGTVEATGDINLTVANGPGSLVDELTLLMMGAL